jgi:hypothetical protein
MQINRVAIFLDRSHFIRSLLQHEIISAPVLEIDKWKVFNRKLLEMYEAHSGCYYSEHSKGYCRMIQHVGTWMFASKRIDLIAEKTPQNEIQEEINFLKHINQVDSIPGFIVSYGSRYKVRNQDLDLELEKEVDVEIVCQMLVGAFHDRYDACILVSDDNDFLPAVERIQNYYGKQVFHAGFQSGRLRAKCYGNIALEEESHHSWLKE